MLYTKDLQGSLHGQNGAIIDIWIYKIGAYLTLQIFFAE